MAREKKIQDYDRLYDILRYYVGGSDGAIHILWDDCMSAAYR